MYGGPRPPPRLTYPLYAFINVDNCERPLSALTVLPFPASAVLRMCRPDRADTSLEPCPCSAGGTCSRTSGNGTLGTGGADNCRRRRA